MKILPKELGDLPISKDNQQIDKPDSKWPKTESTIAIKKEDNARLCELFKRGEWRSLNKSAFFKVNYYNPKDNIFLHMSVK